MYLFFPSSSIVTNDQRLNGLFQPTLAPCIAPLNTPLTPPTTRPTGPTIGAAAALQLAVFITKSTGYLEVDFLA